MTLSNDLHRRGFLGRLAGGAAALAAVNWPIVARAERSERSERVRRAWSEDPDHWLDALTGKHRQIFDVISIEEAGSGLAFARNFLNANNEGYGLADRDVNAVVSFRHKAFIMGLNDAMWDTYHLGELLGYNDPHTNTPATKNPSAGSSDDTRTTSSSLAALHSRGVVFTVCGMAMAAYAGQAAQRAGAEASAVLADFRANLVPGGVAVVAGVIAVNRAQERGFSYVYVG